jgi:hypothetical protein
MTEKRGDWWRLAILLWIAVLLLVSWLIVEVFAWLTSMTGTPFSTINRSLTGVNPIPTIDPSKCMEWDKIDSSSLGDNVCVRGIVQAFGNGENGALLFFSTEPHTFYVAKNSVVAGFHKGDCVMADGIIKTDGDQTLYIDGYPIALCR